MREVIDLGDDGIEPVNFLHHDVVEFLPEIRVVKTLRQELGEGLDRHERIPNLMRHACGQIAPERRAIEQFLFLPQLLLGRQIVDDRDRAEWGAMVEQPARVHREGPARRRIHPMPARQIAVGFESLAQERGNAAAGGFHRFVQDIFRLLSQDFFGGGIKPADDGVFIRGHDPRRNRF